MDIPVDKPESKVEPLFKDRLTAAGLPVQADVVDLLCGLLIDAQAGKLTGIAVLGFSPQMECLQITAEKMPMLTLLGALTQFIHVIFNSGDHHAR